MDSTTSFAAERLAGTGLMAHHQGLAESGIVHPMNLTLVHAANLRIGTLLKLSVVHIYPSKLQMMPKRSSFCRWGSRIAALAGIASTDVVTMPFG